MLAASIWIAVWVLGGTSALLNPRLVVPTTADARQPFIIQCNYASQPNLGPSPQMLTQKTAETTEEPSEDEQYGKIEKSLSNKEPNEIVRNKRDSWKKEAIQSLKLYAGTEEVFRFSPSHKPQWFPSSRLHLERFSCSELGCEVTVRAQPGQLTWRCDLSAEGPTFDLVSSSATVDVYAEPVYSPTIVGEPGGVVSAGTVLLLNCSTDLAAPPALIAWTVDGQQVDENSMSSPAVGPPDEIGLRKSWRGARIVVPPGDAAVRVECVATQPPPASKTRRALVLLQRTQEPQISKYTAAASGTGKTSATVLTTWSLATLLLLSSTAVIEAVHAILPSKRSSLVAMCSHHLLYTPRPTSCNFQYSKDMYNDDASFLGLYLPKIPNVNYHTIQYLLPSNNRYADGYVYNMIDDICAMDIIKGIIVYVEDTSCSLHNMNLEVLDYFKYKQPSIPYALGGCRMVELMFKGTMIEEDEDMIVTMSVFSVPKEPRPVQGPPCQFDMYSLIIDSTVHEKAAIQKVVQTFAENISELEFSAALMLSSYERERWYAYEPELAVELEVFCNSSPAPQCSVAMTPVK